MGRSQQGAVQVCPLRGCKARFPPTRNSIEDDHFPTLGILFLFDPDHAHSVGCHLDGGAPCTVRTPRFVPRGALPHEDTSTVHTQPPHGRSAHVQCVHLGGRTPTPSPLRHSRE